MVGKYYAVHMVASEKTSVVKAIYVSTRCGLWFKENENERYRKTWRGVSCSNCLKTKNRRKP